MRRLIFILLCLVQLSAHALGEGGVRVSLLTCSPGSEVYSLYGHTAVRCQSPADNLDVVFNYGVFDFNEPFFMWRFVLGRCQYMVQPIPWPYFEMEYRMRGSSVTEQVLNLSHEEGRQLLKNLIDNAKPENKYYRYSFLGDNCTTRVRDMIERAIGDTVVYSSESVELTTHRRMLHEYNQVEPWSQEGCDMLLGADVDTMLNQRSAMFLPFKMMQFASDAVIRDAMNNTRPLVLSTEVIIPQGEVETPVFFAYSPQLVAWLVVVLFVLIAVAEYYMHYQLWVIDLCLLLLQGTVSLLLLFMMLISAHPGVHQNWLILLFHPLAFWGVKLVVKAAWNRQRTLWHMFNFAYIVAFLVFSPWMPQSFGKIIVPLALILLTRPISYLMYYRK